MNATRQPAEAPARQPWSALTPGEMAAELGLLGLPPFRAKQLNHALHAVGAWEWDGLTELAKSLGQSLAEARPLRSLTVVTHRTSASDGSQKLLFQTADGEHLESVLMVARDGRRTVCVSSQVGCPAACSFCASGLGGLVRNLTAAEIVDQVEYFAGHLRAEGKPIHNVVFMGMGEPFLNYKRVQAAIGALRAPEGLGLGSRRITVSTVGIVPGIRRFTREPGEVNLAVSLHAPNNELRSRLVPYNERFPLEAILEAVTGYIRTTNRRVSFEYVLLRGVNDAPDLAQDLARLLTPFNPLVHVNLIPWNPFGEAGFSRATKTNAESFSRVLRGAGINATIRYSKGLDIDAACGQLRSQMMPQALAS